MATSTSELRKLLRKQKAIGKEKSLTNSKIRELAEATSINGNHMTDYLDRTEKLLYYGSTQKVKLDFLLSTVEDGEALGERVHIVNSLEKSINNISEILRLQHKDEGLFLKWRAIEDYLNAAYKSDDFKKIRAEDCREVLRNKGLI